MARLEAAPIAAAPLPPVDLPWWLRAAVDPAAVLALALASLVVWRGRWLWASAALAGNALGGGLASFFSSAARVARSSPALDWLSSPDIGLGVEIGFLCLMLIAAPALYRSVLRLTLRAAGAR